MNAQISQILALIHACASGDAEARRQFQYEYGEDIYNFPVKIYGLPAEDAGDFYVYVFERERIFKRINTFEGRDHIQFRTFLSYYVLKHLFLEWQQTLKEIETISLHAPVGHSESERALEDLLPDPMASETEALRSTAEASTAEIWNRLSPEDQLHLKLLSLLECELESKEIRLLATLSGRSIGDTLVLLGEIREELKQKDERLSRLQGELDSVWGWILLRQKELQEIDEKIRLMTEQGDATRQAKLRDKRQESVRTLAKRFRQREKIVKEIQNCTLTTPYKDIARLFNLTVGTMCSRISRLRERLAPEWQEKG